MDLCGCGAVPSAAVAAQHVSEDDTDYEALPFGKFCVLYYLDTL